MSSNREGETSINLSVLNVELDEAKLVDNQSELAPIIEDYLDSLAGQNVNERRLALAIAIAKILQEGSMEGVVTAVEGLLFTVEDVATQAGIDAAENSSGSVLARTY